MTLSVNRFWGRAFAGYSAIGCLALLLVPVIVAWAILSEDAPEPAPTNKSMIIRLADVRGPWPFRVPAVKIDCGDGFAIWVEADGVAVGLTRYTFGKPETYKGSVKAGRGDELDSVNAEPPSKAEVATIARDRCEAAGLRK